MNFPLVASPHHHRPGYSTTSKPFIFTLEGIYNSAMESLPSEMRCNIMIDPTDEAYYDTRLSCTIDEAAAKMIGWMQGSIRKKYIRVTEHGIPAEELPFLHSLDGSLLDQLVEQREAAKQALFVAAEIEDGFYKEYEDVEKFSDLYNNAVHYLSAIKLELAKGELSGLVIDKEATDSTGVTHLFIASVRQWALEKHGITILGLNSLPGNTSEPQALPLEKDKPWLVPDPNDPTPNQPWYIPARYFARQLVKEDSTLLTKRDLLAQKVAQSLTNAGFYKRGGEKPLDSGTVKKAFSKVCLG